MSAAAPAHAPRRRLIAASLSILAGAVVSLGASQAGWWRATDPGVRVAVDGGRTARIGAETVAVSGADVDGVLVAASVLVATLGIVAGLVRPRVRTAALAVAAAGAAYLLVAPLAARGSAEGLAEHAPSFTGDFSGAAEQTAFPWVAAAGGLVALGGAVYGLAVARRAPRIGMPEGPPAQAEDAGRGVWE